MGGMEFGKPRSLKEEEIEDLIDRWAFGAEALYKAGADGCQLRESVNANKLRKPLACELMGSYPHDM
jgi:hypothetical protein